MRTDKILLIVFEVFFVALWIASRRFRWDEQTLENWVTWFWLDRFHVPRTRANCVRFAKGALTFGVIVSLAGTIAVLFWGK